MRQKVDFNELIKLKGIIPDDEYNKRLVDLMSKIGMNVKIGKLNLKQSKEFSMPIAYVREEYK